MLVQDIFDMKLIFSIEQIWNQQNSRNSHYKFVFKQSKYLNQSNSIIFKYQTRFNDDNKLEHFELSYKYHF